MTEDRTTGAFARVRALPDYLLVELHGDLDISSVSRVAPALERAGREASRVVVDLRGVSFFDCALLRLLIRARGQAVARKAGFHLVCDKPRALRILRITDLLRVFAPISSPADLAVGALARSRAPGPGPSGAQGRSPRSDALLSREGRSPAC